MILPVLRDCVDESALDFLKLDGVMLRESFSFALSLSFSDLDTDELRALLKMKKNSGIIVEEGNESSKYVGLLLKSKCIQNKINIRN